MCGAAGEAVRIAIAEDIEALAGCRALAGNLEIRSGTLSDVVGLEALESIRGSVIVGPTLQLASLTGLSGLRHIGGDLDVTGNPYLAGVFLASLRRVDGDVSIDGIRAAKTVSLHGLEQVGGSFEVTDNGDLLRLDIGALRTVDGDFRIEENTALEDVAADSLQRVGGEVALDGNSSLEPSVLESLAKRLTTSEHTTPVISD
jgi:hypothetical protein